MYFRVHSKKKKKTISKLGFVKFTNDAQLDRWAKLR